jgi:hypothetical protein
MNHEIDAKIAALKVEVGRNWRYWQREFYEEMDALEKKRSLWVSERRDATRHSSLKLLL